MLLTDRFRTHSVVVRNIGIICTASSKVDQRSLAVTEMVLLDLVEFARKKSKFAQTPV